MVDLCMNLRIIVMGHMPLRMDHMLFYVRFMDTGMARMHSKLNARFILIAQQLGFIDLVVTAIQGVDRVRTQVIDASAQERFARIPVQIPAIPIISQLEGGGQPPPSRFQLR